MLAVRQHFLRHETEELLMLVYANRHVLMWKC